MHHSVPKSQEIVSHLKHVYSYSEKRVLKQNTCFKTVRFFINNTSNLTGWLNNTSFLHVTELNWCKLFKC